MVNQSKCNEQKDPNASSPNDRPHQQQKVQQIGCPGGAGTAKTKPKRGSKGSKSSTLTKITKYATFGGQAPKISENKPATKQLATKNPKEAGGSNWNADATNTTGSQTKDVPPPTKDTSEGQATTLLSPSNSPRDEMQPTTLVAEFSPGMETPDALSEINQPPTSPVDKLPAAKCQSNGEQTDGTADTTTKGNDEAQVVSNNRRLTCVNALIVKRYQAAFWEQALAMDVPAMEAKLHQELEDWGDEMNPPPGSLVTRFENLVELRMRALRHAEKTCRKLTMVKPNTQVLPSSLQRAAELMDKKNRKQK